MSINRSRNSYKCCVCDNDRCTIHTCSHPQTVLCYCYRFFIFFNCKSTINMRTIQYCSIWTSADRLKPLNVCVHSWWSKSIAKWLSFGNYWCTSARLEIHQKQEKRFENYEEDAWIHANIQVNYSYLRWEGKWLCTLVFRVSFFFSLDNLTDIMKY